VSRKRSRLHHHHHSGRPLAAEARSGRALATGPRLGNERSLAALRGHSAASVGVECRLGNGHQVNGATSV
jgi:hypothetical protein